MMKVVFAVLAKVTAALFPYWQVDSGFCCEIGGKVSCVGCISCLISLLGFGWLGVEVGLLEYNKACWTGFVAVHTEYIT